MAKPIDKVEFWEERIDSAGTNLRLSVYRTEMQTWRAIEKAHRHYLKKFLAKSDKILDGGCGYGRASEFLPEDYTGVDFCPKFIEVAQANYPDKKFFVHSLSALPKNWSDTFDWVICISIRRMIVDTLGQETFDQMLEEMIRVCTKGVIFLEYETLNKHTILIPKKKSP